MILYGATRKQDHLQGRILRFFPKQRAKLNTTFGQTEADKKSVNSLRRLLGGIVLASRHLSCREPHSMSMVPCNQRNAARRKRSNGKGLSSWTCACLTNGASSLTQLSPPRTWVRLLLLAGLFAFNIMPNCRRKPNRRSGRPSANAWPHGHWGESNSSASWSFSALAACLAPREADRRHLALTNTLANACCISSITLPPHRNKLVATGTSDSRAFSENVRLTRTPWSNEHIKCPTRRRSFLNPEAVR